MMTVTGALFINANDASISAGSFVNASAGGYPLRTGVTGAAAISANAGGAYGGRGGDITLTGAGATTTYGDMFSPSDFGSGGYNINGGGLIRFQVANVFTLDGALYSKGGYACGAGAGGSILVQANTLAGSGAINTNGKY